VKYHFGAIAILIFATTALANDSNTYDSYLQKVIQVNDLRPLPTKPFEETNKFKLGRSLFYDPIISGNRDISCATCHLLRRGTSDGLAISSGSGGVGLGENRTLPDNRPQQPRNAPGLWNRDNNVVTSMFWDGRVEMLDPIRRIFRNPLGHELPVGFDNLMAVQAIFPMAQEDELLGRPADRSPADLPSPHGNMPNEIAGLTEHLSRSDQIRKVTELVLRRLVGSEKAPLLSWQSEYRRLFHAAYPNTKLQELTILHAANALSHFEELAFATRNAPWDNYLKGDKNAIGDQAKRGVLVFFGKGRCSVCHSGPLFSDFKFHSVGVKNKGPGIENGDDLGRYHATKDPEDKYKFRTPPLRNATLTSPYFHNGSAATLEAAIVQHMDPLFHADKYEETGRFSMTVEQIEAVSPILLALRIRLSDRDINDVIAFLKSLEDDGMENYQRIVPKTVPSGLPVATINPK
jgi:cytochrome c peroxidase